MPTSIYDSSLITQRRDSRVKSNNFLQRLQPAQPNTPAQNTTSYGPMLGDFNNSILNSVKMGQQKEIRNSVVFNNGCPCNN